MNESPIFPEALEGTALISRAPSFLIGVGVNAGSLDREVNLVEPGVLDSWLLLTFFAFVEQQGGRKQGGVGISLAFAGRVAASHVPLGTHGT